VVATLKLIAVMLAAVALVGCSDSSVPPQPRSTTGTITGHVYMDGGPSPGIHEGWGGQVIEAVAPGRPTESTFSGPSGEFRLVLQAGNYQLTLSGVTSQLTSRSKWTRPSVTISPALWPENECSCLAVLDRPPPRPDSGQQRTGLVRVKGRACSIACDAEGALDACRPGPQPIIACGSRWASSGRWLGRLSRPPAELPSWSGLIGLPLGW
jgi:hypothetical protein